MLPNHNGNGNGNIATAAVVPLGYVLAVIGALLLVALVALAVRRRLPLLLAGKHSSTKDTESVARDNCAKEPTSVQISIAEEVEPTPCTPTTYVTPLLPQEAILEENETESGDGRGYDSETSDVADSEDNEESSSSELLDFDYNYSSTSNQSRPHAASPFTAKNVYALQTYKLRVRRCHQAALCRAEGAVSEPKFACARNFACELHVRKIVSLPDLSVLHGDDREA